LISLLHAPYLCGLYGALESVIDDRVMVP